MLNIKTNYIESLTIELELPKDEVPLPVTKRMTEIRQNWNKLKEEHSSEEVTQMLNDDMKALEEKRVSRATSTKNLPIQAFHDARANILSIDQQVMEPSQAVK